MRISCYYLSLSLLQKAVNLHSKHSVIALITLALHQPSVDIRFLFVHLPLRKSSNPSPFPLPTIG